MRKRLRKGNSSLLLHTGERTDLVGSERRVDRTLSWVTLSAQHRRPNPADMPKMQHYVQLERSASAASASSAAESVEPAEPAHGSSETSPLSRSVPRHSVCEMPVGPFSGPAAPSEVPHLPPTPCSRSLFPPSLLPSLAPFPLAPFLLARIDARAAAALSDNGMLVRAGRTRLRRRNVPATGLSARARRWAPRCASTAHGVPACCRTSRPSRGWRRRWMADAGS